jgi:uncharacterized protein HemX
VDSQKEKPMKNKQLVIRILSVLVFAFVMFKCTKQQERQAVNQIFDKMETSSELAEQEQAAKEKSAEFVRTTNEYLSVAKSRLELNSKRIEEIQQSYKSERTDLRLAFEEEVFELKKRNLALLSRTNNAVSVDIEYWETAKNEIDKEMNSLDRSIADLKEKGNQ